MAFRDARRGKRILLLSMSSIILGVASVVAAFSFRANLESGIQAQAKSLLGADLAISSRQPFGGEAEALIRSLGGEQSRQIGYSSMAYFYAGGKARLVQVRAVSGDFPYYGALETDPPGAKGNDFQNGANALVDETLMLQFDARLGDRVKIGDREFRIAGKLHKIPGEALAFSLISPRVYVPLTQVDRSQLSERGSLVRYRVYFKLDPRTDVDRLVQQIAPQLEQLGLEADTVGKRKAAVARSIDNLSRYLHLAIYIAVLLAGVGVAAGIHVYAKAKTFPVAVLRCLGAGPGETLSVYVIQTSAIALLGSCLGAALGVALQALLPLAFKDFLPLKSVFAFSPRGVAAGMAVGLGTTLLFSLVPLISLRNIPPLLALRASYEKRRRAFDPLRALIFFLIAAAVAGFAAATTERWLHGAWFTASVFAAFGFLTLIARGISAALRKLVPDSLPYPWRQGLANLHRPNSQTLAVMLSIGLGTFLLATLYGVQDMLVRQVAERSGAGEPNLVLFDVQKDQREGVRALFRSFGAREYEETPIVTMRLTAIKDRRVDEIRADDRSAIPAWALRREYRSTYRSRLSSTEKIIAGRWEGKVTADSEPIPVSLEKGIAETLKAGVGDRLEFEVQGVPVRTRVASIREVDWQRVQPNFFVVFPEGTLENAPQFYALVTRAESAERSARLQRAVVENFPNVSMIDLTVVLDTLDSILGRISDAIRFIALFTILTGLSVLASAVMSSRAERLKEAVLMRTLGAARSQIVGAVVAEYLFLGVVSCVTGALLAALAGWGLSFYFLGTASSISFRPLLSIFALVTGATVLAGMLGCWGIFRRPALETLRAES
jgi:putative ABC transport system permease protein